MKYIFAFVLAMFAMSGLADDLKSGKPAPSEVIHVATALDHLTVLEFGEPVTMAAAGSSAFQIERHEDKVLVKPLKAGASTDLFVWTASRRFTYELEAPGEIKNMNFAVDSRISKSKPASDGSPRLEEIADMMLTRALLGAQPVNSAHIKNEKGHVTIRIEYVFETKNTVYISYSVRNLSPSPYHITVPTAVEVVASRPAISITALQHTQLDRQILRRLGEMRENPASLARAETLKENLQPGEETRGVVAIRKQVAAPTILQLTFGAEGPDRVQATMVF
jgi:Conjugal transfer protein